MTYLFVVVKGTRATAEAECARRGIAFTFDAESDRNAEVYGFCEMEDRAKLVDWYCEDCGLAQIAQPGSLLWYAERNN